MNKLKEKLPLLINDSLYDKYMYNNKYVPRVSEIISSMSYEENIIKWANYIGKKRIDYKKYMENAASIGTMVHDMVDNYTNNNPYVIPIDENDDRYKKVVNGFGSFKNWYNTVKSNVPIRLISSEKELVCEWYGGTYDAIYEINNKTYLVDYKTSNNITEKHFIQACAYKLLLEKDGVNLDGIIILQLDKNSDNFYEYISDFSNPHHVEFINSCTNTFLSMLYGYYHKMNTKATFNKLYK